MQETSKALEDVMYETIAVHNHETIVAVEVEEGADKVAPGVVEVEIMDVDEDEDK